MTIRVLVPEGEACMVCSCEVDASTVSETSFAAGYVAGRHAVSKGEAAKEKVCRRHARILDEALLEYVHRGVV